MTLSEFINSLNRKNQIELGIELIEIGLPIWEKYNVKNRIEYTDSVVGMYHKIDKELIEKSIRILKKTNGKNNILTDKINRIRMKTLYDEIREPVVAREDDDFEIPKEVELILFSTSNLIDYVMGRKTNSLNENLAYISINQSIDAITQSGILNFDEIRMILDNKKTCANNV